MRAILGLLLMMTSAGSALVGPRHAVLHAAPLALDPTDPGRRRLGGLRYVEGWVLSSDDPDFGGLSSLDVRRGGFTALSDAGWLYRFRRDGPGFTALAGDILLDGRGRRPQNKMDRDSESMIVAADGATTWVGLEGLNAVWRYGATDRPPLAATAPRAMRKWPEDTGPEAMTRLADGRFVIVSEGGKGPGGARDALLFDRDPSDPAATTIRFGYRPPAGFSPTDATTLTDGRIIILNRRFSMLDGFAAAITLVDPAAIHAGAVLPGREIARLEPPLSVDNMEGLSVVREGDRTILWIISDDNFSPLERTLLMKFVVDPAAIR